MNKNPAPKKKNAKQLKTCALINTSSYQFTVTLEKVTNNFTIRGGHWYRYEDEGIYEYVDTAEEVFTFIRKYISTWCNFSIIQYVDNLETDSRVDFHQMFKNVDEDATTLTMCFNNLRNYNIVAHLL